MFYKRERAKAEAEAKADRELFHTIGNIQFYLDIIKFSELSEENLDSLRAMLAAIESYKSKFEIERLPDYSPGELTEDEKAEVIGDLTGKTSKSLRGPR